MATKTMIEVDGRRYDADTVGKAMLDILYERPPVDIMREWDMRDGILARLCWACGTLSLISIHPNAEDDVKDAASAANRHLEQALAMFRALLERERAAPKPNQPEPDLTDATADASSD